MGTLGNVPLASAHGRCTAAALSCIQWKAHHEFHVAHVIIEYLQQQQSIHPYPFFNTKLICSVTTATCNGALVQVSQFHR